MVEVDWKLRLARLKYDIAAERFPAACRRFVRLAKANPNWHLQPRVPEGNPDGGQWTPVSRTGPSGGRGPSSVRIGGRTLEATPAQAARYALAEARSRDWVARVREIDPRWSPRPNIYETMEGAIRARQAEASEAQTRLAELARLAPRQLIDNYRHAHNARDLLGFETWPRDQNTVAVAQIGRVVVVGPSSGAPPYTTRDRAAAQRAVDTLIMRHPDVMNRINIGGRPNDALYHAEATVLLRASRMNGGSLSGLRFEVHTDRPMCRSCETVLPRLGLELGNPTVTFVGPNGARRTMHNGFWGW
jgi:hypothetical protein